MAYSLQEEFELLRSVNHFPIGVIGQGYLTIVAYLGYLSPGTLKFQTKLHTVNLLQLSKIMTNEYDPIFMESTRRWLQKGESPYPGYCRAPGSGICSPVLCNCTKLKEIWDRVKYTESILKHV